MPPALPESAAMSPPPPFVLPAVMAARARYAESRIAALRARIAEVPELAEVPTLCLYITGSYGRLEASEHSDLDIFFMREGSRKTDALLPVQKTLIDAALIRICRDLGFPEFTGGGQYLTIHYLDDIREMLGGPQDDAQNFFTARMLLLLESMPLWNDAAYEGIIRGMISSYYRDYRDHASTFKPIFFQNDLIRYWKTMCLNYEHRRNRPLDNPVKQAEYHLKNFRLKFSRLLTCFSMILATVYQSRSAVLSDVELLALVKTPPWPRVVRVAEAAGEQALLSELCELYAWFLTQTGESKEVCARWISDRTTRTEAFTRASRFGGLLYRLLERIAEGSDALRYLIM